jgi:hypothetical protein
VCLLAVWRQVRLCLDRQDYVRAQILIRKVSSRAFVERPDKKGENAGEVGIEGTTIEAPAEVGWVLASDLWSRSGLLFRAHVEKGWSSDAKRPIAR